MERLYRSSTQRMLSGVCGGLGEYFNIDPTLVRIVYILVTIATGVLLGIGLYIVLWLIVPSQASVGKSIRESMRENVDEMAQSARDISSEVQATLRRTPTEGAHRIERAALAGLILVAIGVLFLLANLDLLGWLRWARFWPLILIVIGLLLLLRRR
ncbi:MAG: PspC domain-containing protein [Dehalococcoidia bacterium]|nr:PspC domain-containing protein [Dehalococcoidia bacterium]